MTGGQGHHHEGRRRSVGDYARGFFSNWNEFDGPLAEKVKLTLKNRSKAYLVPPVGCCGNRGQPGC
jgi:hypothetical protein